MTQVHVIYHANCADGFGAAWAAHRRLEKEQGLQVAYHPAAYGDPPPGDGPRRRGLHPRLLLPPGNPCGSFTAGTGAG